MKFTLFINGQRKQDHVDDRYAELDERGQYVEHQYVNASAQDVDASVQYVDEYVQDADGHDRCDAQHDGVADNEQLHN